MEKFTVGDKVKITEFYLNNYPIWGASIKDKEAIIVAVKHSKVSVDSLGKDDKSLYHARYGINVEYDLFELHVKIDNHIYVVSQLGFNK